MSVLHGLHLRVHGCFPPEQFTTAKFLGAVSHPNARAFPLARLPLQPCLCSICPTRLEAIVFRRRQRPREFTQPTWVSSCSCRPLMLAPSSAKRHSIMGLTATRCHALVARRSLLSCAHACLLAKKLIGDDLCHLFLLGKQWAVGSRFDQIANDAAIY